MPRRTTHAGEDSLELLLDTICNTFGGVLFIAILLAISVRPEPTSPVAPVKAEDRLAAARAEDLQAQIDDLREAIAGMGDIAAALDAGEVSSDDVREALAAEAKAAETLAAATRARDQQDQAATEAIRRRGELGEATDDPEVVNLDRQIEAASVTQAELQATLQRAKEAATQTTTVPEVTRPSGKPEAAFVLENGRVYRWHDHFGVGRSLNRDDMEVVSESAAAARPIGPRRLLRSREGFSSTFVRPRADAGIPTDADNAREQLTRVLSAYPATEYTIVLVVRTDSFASYALMRDLVKAQGSRFRLFATDGIVSDFGGSGGPSQ